MVTGLPTTHTNTVAILRGLPRFLPHCTLPPHAVTRSLTTYLACLLFLYTLQPLTRACRRRYTRWTRYLTTYCRLPVPHCRVAAAAGTAPVRTCPTRLPHLILPAALPNSHLYPGAAPSWPLPRLPSYPYLRTVVLPAGFMHCHHHVLRVSPMPAARARTTRERHFHPAPARHYAARCSTTLPLPPYWCSSCLLDTPAITGAMRMPTACHGTRAHHPGAWHLVGCVPATVAPGLSSHTKLHNASFAPPLRAACVSASRLPTRLPCALTYLGRVNWTLRAYAPPLYPRTFHHARSCHLTLPPLLVRYYWISRGYAPTSFWLPPTTLYCSMAPRCAACRAPLPTYYDVLAARAGRTCERAICLRRLPAAPRGSGRVLAGLPPNLHIPPTFPSCHTASARAYTHRYIPPVHLHTLVHCWCALPHFRIRSSSCPKRLRCQYRMPARSLATHRVPRRGAAHRVRRALHHAILTATVTCCGLPLPRRRRIYLLLDARVPAFLADTAFPHLTQRAAAYRFVHFCNICATYPTRWHNMDYAKHLPSAALFCVFTRTTTRITVLLSMARVPRTTHYRRIHYSVRWFLPQYLCRWTWHPTCGSTVPRIFARTYVLFAWFGILRLCLFT